MDLATIVYAFLAGVIPALLWLWFWLREDNLQPEPRSSIALSFIAGGFSIILAVILEAYAVDFISDNNYLYITWAGIEEAVKFLVIATVAFQSRYMDEPIDAMIYSITVALGFSAVENALFILHPLSTGEISKSIVTGDLRFVGATLLHVVSSASIGFLVGMSFYKPAFVKVLAGIFGLILATALHAGFNLAIIDATVAGTLKVFGLVWCAAVILLILFEEIKAVKPKTA